MSKFDLKKIEAVKGQQVFYQLVIAKKKENPANNSNEGVMDQYEKSLETKYKQDISSIYTYMNRVANNEHVPGKKYHELTDRPKNDLYKDYEFKSGDLRVYATKSKEGKIIILCGYKNNQSKDIKKMRLLKLQYFESLKK